MSPPDSINTPTLLHLHDLSAAVSLHLGAWSLKKSQITIYTILKKKRRKIIIIVIC